MNPPPSELRRVCRTGLSAAAAAAMILAATEATADRLTIKYPGRHPHYVFEAEPHLNIGLIDPPGIGAGKGIGAGFRGTLELVDNGFVDTINNTVGITFGFDYVNHGVDERDQRCIDWDPGPTTSRTDDVCLEFRESAHYFLIPVGMQWNFWLSEQWSVFGEPAAVIYLVDYEEEENELNLDVGIYAGGRWHFSPGAALTMRLGYPTFSVGVSFLL